MATGLVLNDYLLGILITLAGIGSILFSLPFLILPLPMDLNLKMTVSHKCDKDGPNNDNDKPDWGPVVGEDDDDDDDK